MEKTGCLPSLANEYRHLRVGDVRLRQRAVVIVEKLAANPALTFPRAMEDVANREAFYRFLSNGAVTQGALVDAHAAESVARAKRGSTVLVAHDTTEFTFSGDSDREGLGRARSQGQQAFFAHVALGLDEVGKPLGVLGDKTWAREGPSRGNRKLSGAQLAKIVGRESDRWLEVINDTESRLGGRASAIHVTDREGDSYALLEQLDRAGRRFVIRAARDRGVVALDHNDEELDAARLSELTCAFACFLTRDVALSARRSKPQPRTNKTHVPRNSRPAKLSVSAGRLAFVRPAYLDDTFLDTLPLNVVVIREVEAPPEIEPVGWVLLTNEPIDTSDQVEAIVDHYRARWTIEEFFKAIKTGCAFEERQLESYKTLTKALALLYPIAWQMLLLRWMSRVAPDAPAESVLNETQIAVLKHCRARWPVGRPATALDALYAVAGMGGHFKNNGPPGWQTLGFGMQRLVDRTAMWLAGIASQANNRQN